VIKLVVGCLGCEQWVFGFRLGLKASAIDIQYAVCEFHFDGFSGNHIVSSSANHLVVLSDQITCGAFMALNIQGVTVTLLLASVPEIPCWLFI
jgi:hypothetical protein